MFALILWPPECWKKVPIVGLSTGLTKNEVGNFLLFSRCQELSMAGQLKRLSNLRLGEACVVRWSKDQKMHRAEIVSLSTDNEATVYFVDNGNRATEVPHTELFVPPPDLLSIPKLLFFVQELYYGPAKEGLWMKPGSWLKILIAVDSFYGGGENNGIIICFACFIRPKGVVRFFCGWVGGVPGYYGLSLTHFTAR
jgi:hypothetical protein